MRVAVAFVHFKQAILEKAEVQKLEKAKQEVKEALQNLTDEDIQYLLEWLKDYVYITEALRKKSQKLDKAEEFIQSIRDRFDTFKL